MGFPPFVGYANHSSGKLAFRPTQNSRTTVEAGKLAAFWAAIPHQIVGFDGNTPYFVVTAPLSEFLQASHDVGFVNRILRGEVLIESVTDECDALTFRQWERELREKEPAHEAAARLEVQARLIRFARRVGNRPANLRPAANPPRADQIACYIARNYHEPLTSQSIADAVGLHPNWVQSLWCAKKGRFSPRLWGGAAGVGVVKRGAFRRKRSFLPKRFLLGKDAHESIYLSGRGGCKRCR